MSYINVYRTINTGGEQRVESAELNKHHGDFSLKILST